MAITPTGSIYKALKFDGVSSRNYGVYITGEAVFNAPERDVEMITIPGRNGAFALDNGRFQNIEVSYPAGIFADNEEDFAEAISEFRNYLCSKRGYCRLQDEYNPDEYRLAIYKSGLEVEPAFLKAGEFTITFECKPQRFLTSGETKQTIANSGDTITNPTLFESGPLLEVEGDGNIEFNGYKITINDVPLGEIETSGKNTDLIATYVPFSDLPLSYSKQIDYSAFRDAIENGDSIFIDSLKITAISTLGYRYLHEMFTIPGATPSPTITSNIGTASASGAVTNTQKSFIQQNYYVINFTINASISDIELTAFTDEQYTANITAVLKDTSNNTLRTLDITVNIDNYNSGLLEITLSFSGTDNTVNGFDFYNGRSIEYGRTYIYSTQSVLGNPLYLDCDLGEAYKIEGGTVIGINQHVDLGSKLPTLSPGSNAITYDNTITDLKITPRWWKV